MALVVGGRNTAGTGGDWRFGLRTDSDEAEGVRVGVGVGVCAYVRGEMCRVGVGAAVKAEPGEERMKARLTGAAERAAGVPKFHFDPKRSDGVSSLHRHCWSWW